MSEGSSEESANKVNPANQRNDYIRDIKRENRLPYDARELFEQAAIQLAFHFPETVIIPRLPSALVHQTQEFDSFDALVTGGPSLTDVQTIINRKYRHLRAPTDEEMDTAAAQYTDHPLEDFPQTGVIFPRRNDQKPFIFLFTVLPPNMLPDILLQR